MRTNTKIVLIELIQHTMEKHIGKKEVTLSLQNIMREISKTEAFLYLKFNDNNIDVENFVITFIRFFTTYSTDLDTICNHFTLLINKIKLVVSVLENPEFSFMADANLQDLLDGYLTPDTFPTTNPEEKKEWHL